MAIYHAISCKSQTATASFTYYVNYVILIQYIFYYYSSQSLAVQANLLNFLIKKIIIGLFFVTEKSDVISIKLQHRSQQPIIVLSQACAIMLANFES